MITKKMIKWEKEKTAAETGRNAQKIKYRTQLKKDYLKRNPHPQAVILSTSEKNKLIATPL